MAAGRYADSDERVDTSLRYSDVDFDVDENWHVDFGHAGVRQMSVKQIAEAWSTGALLESTLVWHEGLSDWEEVLAVPQIARAIGALMAAPERPRASYDSVDLDDAASDWDATVVSERSGGLEGKLAPGGGQRPLAMSRSLPRSANLRGAAGSSLPPPPDVKAAFQTHEWVHSPTPPPSYARENSAPTAPRFSRPEYDEAPELPTAKVPSVLKTRRAPTAQSLPARPNPASAHPSSAPLSVVRVDVPSKPALRPSEIPEASSRRLLIWGSLGGAAFGVVLLLLGRLLGLTGATETTSFDPESAPPPSAELQPVAKAPKKSEALPPEPARPEEDPSARAASAIEPEAPSEPAPVNTQPSPSDPAPAEPKVQAAQNVPSAPPAKAEVTGAEDQKRALQSAPAVPVKEQPTPAPKEKEKAVAAPPPKPVVAPPSAPAEETEKPAVVVATPTKPSAPDPAFKKDAAVATLNAAAASVGRCPNDVKGPGTVRVIFSPDGSVRSVSIVSGDFEATATGTCVTRAFQRCKVPPFSGKPAAVNWRFVIN